MNASELLQHLAQVGLARARSARPGIVQAMAIGSIEVAVAERPSDTFMRARWKESVGGTATPYLVIADDPQHPGRVRVLGPTLGNRPIQSVNSELLSDSLQHVAASPPFDAVRRLADDLTRISGDGLTFHGLLTRHTLEYRFKGDPSRWASATERLRGVRPTDSWRRVLTKLGYTLQQLPNRGHLARRNGRPTAVIHPKAAARDLARVDRQGRPPEGLLLEDCEAQGTPFGILAQGGRFRLFDACSATPASEWLELDIRLLGKDRLPFLALLAPPFLAEGGFSALLNEARDFGVKLHERLDRTIRQDALPALAVGMQAWAKERGVDLTNDRERTELERAALTLVFRVVFILFCESAGHLPMGNRTYEKVSLSSLVREAYETQSRLSPASSALWSGFVRLVRAMRNGNPAWDVPAYNGALFASRDFDGAELLERMELRDPEFAKVLVAIGQDQETRRGADFSTLEIAHIGHTYESLLSLKLSLAKRAVRYDARRDRYVVARELGDTEVKTGGLLWQTHQGGRKAGGVYYTPVEIVRHLVTRAVLPAYERHLEEVAEIAKTDPKKAARHLLSFAVVDPACGSAHFLVQVAETLAERTVRFLAEHPLPAIVEAMDRLRSGHSPGVEIDDMSLLRRLLVKHCVFGVDISPMGAEVATLSLWLASFVPGLSLSYLGRNVVVGDSLIGVADPYAVVERWLFTDLLKGPLDEATKIVRSLARIDDRTPEEVAASRAADQRAKRATAGLKRLLDLWTSEQFGLGNARHHAELHGGTVIDGSDRDSKALVRQAQELSKKYNFLHWPLAFPQVFSRERPGFDVVVGNPPWEQVRVEELSFYGMWRPGIQSLKEADRAATVAELVRERPDLLERLRDQQEQLKSARSALAAGDYNQMGAFPDLYKYFCQRYRTLVRGSGFIGVVLPRTAFNTKGSEGFREWLYVGSATHRIDFLLNKGRWIFDSEPRYSIALVVAERASPGSAHRIEVAGTAMSPTEWGHQTSTEGVRLTESAFGPGRETPMLRSQDEADLLVRLRRGHPFPHGAGGRWSCFPVQGDLNETNDRRFWRGQTYGRPLWKGESFDQYEPTGAGERTCPVTDQLLKKVRKARPGLKSLIAAQTPVALRRIAVLAELERARLAFRDVARSTDSRTIRACLVPPGVFLTNKAPYLAFVNGYPKHQAACLGLMNSLTFDWQARRFIEINANFFLIEGFYLPDLDDEDFTGIAQAAARLSAVGDRFSDFAAAIGVDYGPLDPTDRTELRVDIDARVARAWNLTRADLDVIFRDFTEDAVTPAYRSALIDRLEQLT